MSHPASGRKSWPALPACVSLILLPVFASPAAAALGSAPGTCLTGNISITRDTVLDPACTHQASLRIGASKLTLDCRGSRIDAGGRRVGIEIGGKTGVSDVTVRNCNVLNAKTGIYVGLTGSDAKKAQQYSREELYARTPHHVRIENGSVRNSSGVGIYIDDYASEVTVEGTLISDSGSAGIYLEHSSRRNRILNSTLSGNGYGKFPDLRLGAARREAIAVDSSAHNRIEGNHIHDNAAGGIFLYKNCHEHARSNPASVPRWQAAEHNLIKGNTIENENVGIWLASRQSRDLGAWGCGDRPYLGNRYFPDYARHNLVEANTFRRVGTGIIVEDDDNALIGNRFVESDKPIEIGARLREQALGKKVERTQIRDNKIEATP